MSNQTTNKYDDFLRDINKHLKFNELCKGDMFEFADTRHQRIVDKTDILPFASTLTLTLRSGVNTFSTEYQRGIVPFKTLCLYLFEILGQYFNPYKMTFNVMITINDEYVIYHNRGDEYLFFSLKSEEDVLLSYFDEDMMDTNSIVRGSVFK